MPDPARLVRRSIHLIAYVTGAHPVAARAIVRQVAHEAIEHYMAAGETVPAWLAEVHAAAGGSSHQAPR